MELPKYNKSQETGEIGLSIVKKVVESQLNWIFRKNHQEHDFGIDAYIDVIAEFGQVTGKSIALQIKTGKSYFDEETELGWVYRGQMSHLNYYLNHQIPIIILIVNDQTEEIFWCLCDADKTDKAGNNWKIIIPRRQRLTKESKTELAKYISPVIDYVSQLEHFWEGNKILKEHDRIMLFVAKDEILEMNFSNLVMSFNRFETSGDDLIIHLRNKIDIFVHGYDYDSRELYEIPEVMQWAREIYKQIDNWPYFLAMDEASQFVKVLFVAHCNYKRISPNQIEYETSSTVPFLESMFAKLNTFCEKYSISDEVNIDITTKFMNVLTNGEFGKSQKE